MREGLSLNTSTTDCGGLAARAVLFPMQEEKVPTGQGTAAGDCSNPARAKKLKLPDAKKLRDATKKAKHDLREATRKAQERTNELLEDARKNTRKTHRWLIAIEGKLHFLLVNLPVAGPLACALFCACLLIFQDIQSPLDTPWVFQLSLLFCLMAVLGWLSVKVFYGILYCWAGLNPRQRWATTIFLFTAGIGFFALRMGHLVWFSSTRGQLSALASMTSVTELESANRIGEITDERLRRIFVGVPYAIGRYVGLDMWGWAIGNFLFYTVLLGGFFCCCFFNCFGALRIFQEATRRPRDGMPFTDMVSNRVASSSFNGVLFMFPFVVLSTYVLGGTVLIEPSRSFATADQPHRMTALCSPVVSQNLYALATNAARRIGEFALPADLYQMASSNRKAGIFGNMLLDIAWKAALEPIETQCDGVFAAPMMPDVTSFDVPTFAVAVRDINDQSALLRENSVVSATLVRQPSNHAADCAVRATLLGQTALPISNAGIAHVGTLRFNATFLGDTNESAIGLPLCAGDYVFRIALHEASWLASRLASLDSILNSSLQSVQSPPSCTVLTLSALARPWPTCPDLGHRLPVARAGRREPRSDSAPLWGLNP